jgi:outer membrane receptor protein involved in Fe transport
MNQIIPTRAANILLAVVFASVALKSAGAQVSVHLRGSVRDTTGLALRGATVTVEPENLKVVTDANGDFNVDMSPMSGTLTLRASTAAMESAEVQVDGKVSHDGIQLIVHPSAVAEQITVAATRSSAAIGQTANTIYALASQQLVNYPALTLDQRLGQLPSFMLFRRASSLIANPTSLGVSLRGLGSTAASRTLVIEDGVPMNDPFGAWIHWNEVPALAVDAVTIATGGGSDLYGSAALGGVIDLAPARPAPAHAEISASGGSEDTSSVSLRGDLSAKRWGEMLAGDALRTGGYIPTAPNLAGPIDQPANVHDQAVRSETDHLFSPTNRAFLTGNLLNEARDNGTELQNNGTRLWRYFAGDDWTAGPHTTGRARLFGSDEGYRQTFSSINATRMTESLTRLQRVRSQELGASADASFALGHFAFVTGADARDIRATDNEAPISTTTGKSTGIQDTSARQRFVGGFGEVLATHGGWSAALSLRVDYAANLDTRALTQTFASQSTPTTTATTNRQEWIPSPRLGLVRQLGHAASLHASVFRAFRTPTMNELYRTGQVGQQTTDANSQLLSERGSGWEVGATVKLRSELTVNATYFWTEINRPVSTVLIASTATTQTLLRENLGQVRSQGTELNAQWSPRSFLSVSGGYQYANAVVTQFSAQPSLVGNWIPEVPRQAFTAQVRAHRSRIGEITFAAKANGKAFDDSANTFVLGSFIELDLSARHNFGSRWSAFTNLQNLLNQRADVSETPTLTLGSPFVATAGIAYRWGESVSK